MKLPHTTLNARIAMDVDEAVEGNPTEDMDVEEESHLLPESRTRESHPLLHPFLHLLLHQAQHPPTTIHPMRAPLLLQTMHPRRKGATTEEERTVTGVSHKVKLRPLRRPIMNKEIQETSEIFNKKIGTFARSIYKSTSKETLAKLEQTIISGRK